MPNQVQIIQQRNSVDWDKLIQRAIDKNAWRKENSYMGIATQHRAEEVRRKLRTAARHKNVGSRIYWKECDANGNCKAGSDCEYHVYYTIFDMEEARTYKQKQASSNQQRRR